MPRNTTKGMEALSTDIPKADKRKLERMAARNDRTPAAEARIAIRNHVSRG